MSGSGGSTFALSGRAVIALAIGCLLLTGLAFAAGWIAAGQRAARRAARAAAAAEAPSGLPAEAPADGVPGQGSPGAGAPPAESWSVRLGAFLVEEEAEVLLAALTERGYQPYSAVVAAADGGRQARTVLVGPYAERDEAIRVARSLAEREGLRAVVVLDDARPTPLRPVAATFPAPAAAAPPEPRVEPAATQPPAQPSAQPPAQPTAQPSTQPPAQPTSPPQPSTPPPTSPEPSPAPPEPPAGR